MTLETVKTFVMIETARYLITGKRRGGGRRAPVGLCERPQPRLLRVTEAALGPLDLPDRGRQVDFLLVARHEVTLIAPAWPVRPSPGASDTPRVYDVVAK